MGVDKKNPAGEGGAGDANEPTREGRLGNLRATPIWERRDDDGSESAGRAVRNFD